MDNNCFAVVDQDSREAALIDPGFGAVPILDDLPADTKVRLILLTHGHFDHVADLAQVAETTGARIGIHKADSQLLSQAPQFAEMFGLRCDPAPDPDFFLEPGSDIELGRSRIGVRYAPGHSQGSVVFVTENVAIVGDCLFAGSIGRTDLPGGNHQQLLDSIHRQILILPDETVVWPGHGPDTTVGHERLTNPYLV